MLLSETYRELSPLDIPATIATCTLHEKILWVCPGLVDPLANIPAYLVGQNWIQVMHPDDREAFAAASEQVFARPERRAVVDARVRSAAGDYRWLEHSLTALPGGELVVHLHDVDERKRREVELEMRVRELAKSNDRLEHFAQGAAHDLREPLRAIAVFTESLVRTRSADEKSRQAAAFIVAGVARMTALIDDMLPAAPGQRPGGRADLAAAVTQAAQNLAPELLRTGADLEVGRLPEVPGTEIQFVRIFQNLISNALKYRRPVPIRIDIRAERVGLDWVVAVRDNGQGIAVEHQSEIFAPFTRVSASDAQGTGLGLTLTKRIVEGFGGAYLGKV